MKKGQDKKRDLWNDVAEMKIRIDRLIEFTKTKCKPEKKEEAFKMIEDIVVYVKDLERRMKSDREKGLPIV